VFSFEDLLDALFEVGLVLDLVLQLAANSMHQKDKVGLFLFVAGHIGVLEFRLLLLRHVLRLEQRPLYLHLFFLNFLSNLMRFLCAIYLKVNRLVFHLLAIVEAWLIIGLVLARD
jgi:hypothetical protein